jgi:hypothetical protein
MTEFALVALHLCFSRLLRSSGNGCMSSPDKTSTYNKQPSFVGTKSRRTVMLPKLPRKISNITDAIFSSHMRQALQCRGVTWPPYRPTTSFPSGNLGRGKLSRKPPTPLGNPADYLLQRLVGCAPFCAPNMENGKSIFTYKHDLERSQLDQCL